MATTQQYTTANNSIVHTLADNTNAVLILLIDGHAMEPWNIYADG